MDGHGPGFRALKPFEKDGKWGVAASEELVPAYDMTRKQALEAIDSFYKLGGRTEQQHTDDFHEFYAQRRQLAEKHLEDLEREQYNREGGSRIAVDGPKL